MGAESLIDMMKDFYIARLVKILHIQKFLDMSDAFLGKSHRAAFFLHGVVSVFF